MGGLATTGSELGQAFPFHVEINLGGASLFILNISSDEKTRQDVTNPNT